MKYWKKTQSSWNTYYNIYEVIIMIIRIAFALLLLSGFHSATIKNGDYDVGLYCAVPDCTIS